MPSLDFEFWISGIDEAEKNMQKMIYHAAANLIESNVESAKNTITQSLTDLQEIAALASAYKSGKNCLMKNNQKAICDGDGQVIRSLFQKPPLCT